MTDLAVLIADDATLTAPLTKVSGKMWTALSCPLPSALDDALGVDVEFGSSGGANGSVLKSEADTNDSAAGMKAASICSGLAYVGTYCGACRFSGEVCW